MGIPGLLAISFLDSAAIPLSGGPDAVILGLACTRPSLAYIIGLVATIGSTLGSLVLYGIGSKGGARALSRFNPARIARVEETLRKHSFWAVAGAVLAPPPFPTKLVVIAAGVLRTGRWRFAGSVFAGRAVRYMLIAFLAAHFGKHALQILKNQYPAISIALIACLVLIILLYFYKKSR